MAENKKMMKIEGVEKFEFMTFVRTKNDGTTFYSFATTADMITPRSEKLLKYSKKSGQKWLDVYFVKKNREECYKAIKVKDKAKYTIDKPTKVWIAENARGYLCFIIECAPESIHPYVKEANKDEPKNDVDDLPF